jgi:hypothetical protein
MSDAQEMVKKMRVAKEDAKPKQERPKFDPEQLKVRLIIAPHRRHQLVMWLVLAFGAFVTILGRDMNIDKPWWLTSLPIVGLGLMICLIPATEEWEYKPWQTRARQYERHQLER